MPKASASVTEVMVMETAASLSVCPSRSSVLSLGLVWRQQETRMNRSSMPMPGYGNKEKKYVKILNNV